MTLREIEERHNAWDAEYKAHDLVAPDAHADRAKLIEWLKRAVPIVQIVANIGGPAARALLREINGEKYG